MELQVSYSICTKIQKNGHLWSDKKRYRKILRQLCEYKEVKIIEGEMCPDHVHMLVEIPPKISIANFMGYLKGKSTLRIFDKYSNLKYTSKYFMFFKFRCFLYTFQKALIYFSLITKKALIYFFSYSPHLRKCNSLTFITFSKMVPTNHNLKNILKFFETYMS